MLFLNAYLNLIQLSININSSIMNQNLECSSAVQSKQNYNVCGTSNQNKTVQNNRKQSNNQQKNQQEFSNFPIFSPYVDQYLNFFEEVENHITESLNTVVQDTQKLAFYKMKIINVGEWATGLLSYEQPFLTILNIQRCGAIVNYQAIIANFRIDISLLNVNQQAPLNLEQLGSGTYGRIMQLNYRKTSNFIAKRIIFKKSAFIWNEQSIYIQPNQSEIRDVIFEYSIYKIASFFEIGPRIETTFEFDLICFSDAIQFYLEKCIKNYRQFLQYQNEQKINYRFKYCLRFLHRLKIIHKDVKPQNILYSCHWNKYVLSDFGISHAVHQNIGHKTQTYKQGTLSFMSQQMKALNRGQIGYVDLYYNDMYSLKRTLCILKQNIKYRKVSPNLVSRLASKQITTRSKYNSENVQAAIFYLSILMYSRAYKCNQQVDIQSSIEQIFEIEGNLTNIPNLEMKLKKKIQQIQLKAEKGNFSSRKYFIEFLIRTIGIDKELQPFLVYAEDKRLFQKLQAEIEKVKVMYSPVYLRKLKLFGQQRRLEHILEHELKLYQNGVVQLQNDKITQILIGLFDIKFNRIEQLEECKVLIKKMKQANANNWIQQIQMRQRQILVVQNEQLNINGIMNTHHLIKFLMTKQKYQQVLKLIQTNHLNSDEYSIYKAKAYQKLGDKQKANQYYHYNLKCHLANNSQGLSEAYKWLAQFYFNSGEYKSSISMYNSAIQQQLQSKHKSVYLSELYSQIAVVYISLNTFLEAIKYLQQALKLRQELYTNKHPQIYRIYNNLAICYRKMGDYDQAISFNEKALELRLFNYGQLNYFTSCSYVNLAACYLSIGRLQQAEQLYLKAYGICVKLYQPTNSKCLFIREMLADIYTQSKNHCKATQIYAQLIQTYTQQGGQYNYVVSCLLNKLGISYQHTQLYSQAHEQYNAALTNFYRLFQQDHIKIAEVLNNIGTCFIEQNKFQKAIYYLQRALEIREKQYGKHHIDTLSIHVNLAETYSRNSKLAVSIELMQEVLKIQRLLFGEDNVLLVANYIRLANYQSQNGQYGEAINTINSSLKMMREHRMPLEQINCYQLLSKICQKQARFKESIQYGSKILSICRQLQADDTLAHTYLSIGQNYLHLKQFDLAISNLNKSLTHFERANSSQNYIVKCLIDYRDCYISQQNHSQIIQFYQTKLVPRIHYFTAQQRYELLRDNVRCAMSINQFSKAFKYFMQAFALKPLAINWNQIGQCSFKAQRYRHAIYFKTKVKAKTLLDNAYIAESYGKLKSDRKCFLKYLTLYNEYPQAENRMISFYKICTKFEFGYLLYNYVCNKYKMSKAGKPQFFQSKQQHQMNLLMNLGPNELLIQINQCDINIRYGLIKAIKSIILLMRKLGLTDHKQLTDKLLILMH